MLEVLELKGFKSLRAWNAFSSLLLGLKMLPAHQMIPYEEFYESFKDKTEAQKETLVREAVAFVPLEESEVMAMVTFCKDANGIPYSEKNIKNLSLAQLNEIIVAVAMEIGRIKIDIVSDEEKKKPLTFQ